MSRVSHITHFRYKILKLSLENIEYYNGLNLIMFFFLSLVDSVKQMLGTFSPQQEPYTYDMPEETTPSGYFARGSYSAKTKVSV